MTAMKEEENFPRGRSSGSKPALRKVKDKLFQKHKKPKKKSFKNSFFEENQIKGKFKTHASSNDLEPSHSIRSLTYQSLEEGMVVVGRVREVHPFHLFICLPGKLSAKVPISAISQPYSESLARLQKLEITQKECPPLEELFTAGQAVVCSVVQVQRAGAVLAVVASLDPALVNRERSHHAVRAGHTLVAAVRSVEDHGYNLDTGIAGLTTFLKFGNAAKYIELRNQGKPLVVGEVVRVVVTKCATARSASRAEVTLDPRVVAGAVITDGNAQTLHPGTPAHCVVTQSSKLGLIVSVGRTQGYIESNQLPSCWSSPKYFQPEEEFTATVLYSLPNKDFQITARPTYLTLKDLSQPSAPSMAVGDVIEARITASGRKGLILCLGEKKDKTLGNKGFVSVRRLGEVIPKEEIAKKFPKGTTVTTKILGFDYMEEIYNCTLERSKLEQCYVSAAQVRVGDRVSCRVARVEPDGLRLTLGPVRMYAFREHSADIPHSDLALHFRPDDIVDVRVLRSNPVTRQVYVTLKETLIRSPALTSYEAARPGECYWGTVRKVNPSGSVYVTFYNDVAGVLQLGEHQSSSQLTEGQLVKCYITKVDVPSLRLSLSKPDERAPKKNLTLGEFYQVVITNVRKDCLEVSPCDFEGIEGLVPKCHLPDASTLAEGDFIRAWLYHKKGRTHYFSPNTAMEYFFKNPTSVKPRYRMTLCVNGISQKKVSLLTALPTMPVVQIPIQTWPVEDQPKLHQLVRLFVEEYNPETKTLKLTYNKPTKQANEIKGQDSRKSKKLENEAKLSKAKHQKESEEESESPPPAKEPQEEKTQTSTQNMCKKDLKSSGKQKQSSEKNSKEHLKKDDSKVIQKGDASGELNTSNFICVDSSETTKINKGKVRNFEVSEQKETLTEENDISKVKTESGELLNSDDESDLNSSDFDSDDNAEETLVNENKGDKHKKRKSSESDSDAKQDSKSIKRKRKSSVSDCDNTEDSKAKVKQLIFPKRSKPTLSETGFQWDIKPEDLSKPSEDVEDDDDEEEEDSKGEKKKKSSGGRLAAAAEEARLRRVEQTLMETESEPQSVEQFDRAVLARPDDDQLWIRYMAHHLQATEVEKARAVARRALNTVSRRLETERLNVWIALLNLENLYGTQESLKNTLDEALRTNDEFPVYSKMLNIYTQANKAQEAEKLVHVMLRKFRESPDCWVVCCSALLGCGLADRARNVLQRGVTALPAKQHVNLLCRFALLENQHGNSEQAQTLFEHILTTYPKRTDIWNVYVDMLVKSDKVNVARQILERATKQKLPPKKMKMLFNKWISFEEKNGTPEKVDYVRKQALAYINNLTSKLDQE